MKLDSKKIESLFNEIRTGLRVLQIRKLVIYLKYPNPSLMGEVSFYEEELKKRYKDVFPSRDEVMEKFNKRIKTEKNVQSLEYLLNKEKKLTATIEHFEKMGMSDSDQTLVYYLEQKASIYKEIKKSRIYESETNSLTSVKEKALSNCFESKINQTIIIYYIQRSMFFKNNDQLLPLFKHLKFKNIHDRMHFINELFDHFLSFMYGYEENKLRALARSPYVSNLYKISHKTNTPIFKGSASEYSQLQVNLLSWCDYYHSIFSNLGAPEKHIIEDDILFDKWVENKIDDMKPSDKKGKPNSDNRTTSEQTHKFIFKEPTRAMDSNNFRTK